MNTHNDSSSAPADAGRHHAHEQLFDPMKILIILVVLTALSYASEFLPLGAAIGMIWIFGIATAKAFFVVTRFMNLKFEGPWKWVLVVPPCIMAILLVLALWPDFGSGFGY